jgi:hypothetical protein
MSGDWGKAGKTEYSSLILQGAEMASLKGFQSESYGGGKESPTMQYICSG